MLAMDEAPLDCLIIGGGPAGLTAAIYLARFHLSILVVDGGKSPASLRKASDALAERMPNAERHTLKGQSHNISMKMVAPVLEDFLLDRR